MPKRRHEAITSVSDGIYLITQDLLTSDWFQLDDINRMVAMGIESQVGIALAAVIDGQVKLIDGSLPVSLVRLVLDSNLDSGFTCLEPTTTLVARYSYVPVHGA